MVTRLVRWFRTPMTVCAWCQPARTVLRYGATKYDLVVSEPSNVWIPGVAHLFTRESFADVRGCLDPEDGLRVTDLDPARQRADGVSEHLDRDRRNVDGELDPTRGHARRPSPASADDAALRFATTALARLAHLAFALHRGLLVITAPLDLLQDPFLRHLLLQDLQRLVDGIPDFYFQRSAEQRLQKGLLGESGDLTLQTWVRQGTISEGCPANPALQLPSGQGM